MNIIRAWKRHRAEKRAAKARAAEQWEQFLATCGKRKSRPTGLMQDLSEKGKPYAAPADIQTDIDAIRDAAQRARIHYGLARVREAVERYDKGWSASGVVTSGYRSPEDQQKIMRRSCCGGSCCPPKND